MISYSGYMVCTIIQVWNLLMKLKNTCIYDFIWIRGITFISFVSIFYTSVYFGTISNWYLLHVVKCTLLHMKFHLYHFFFIWFWNLTDRYYTLLFILCTIISFTFSNYMSCFVSTWFIVCCCYVNIFLLVGFYFCRHSNFWPSHTFLKFVNFERALKFFF